MQPSREYLIQELGDTIRFETQIKLLKRQGVKQRIHRKPTAAWILALILCLASVVPSCGRSENTALYAASSCGVSEDTALNAADIGVGGGPFNDGVGSSRDWNTTSQQQFDDPSENLEPVESARVPNVIGLSLDDADTLIKAAEFVSEVAFHDDPTPGVEDLTVTGVQPSHGTLLPVGSLITMKVYLDFQPNATPEERRYRQIDREIKADFGDCFARGWWDEINSTYIVRIIYLSNSEADRLQTYYNDETFAVKIVSAAVTRTELLALKQSTWNLFQLHNYLSECAAPGSEWEVGVDSVNWTVSIGYALIPDDSHLIDECVNEMKQVVLANAADFVKEHSILANPSELVRFKSYTPDPDGDILFD